MGLAQPKYVPDVIAKMQISYFYSCSSWDNHFIMLL